MPPAKKETETSATATAPGPSSSAAKAKSKDKPRKSSEYIVLLVGENPGSIRNGRLNEYSLILDPIKYKGDGTHHQDFKDGGMVTLKGGSTWMPKDLWSVVKAKLEETDPATAAKISEVCSADKLFEQPPAMLVQLIKGSWNANFLTMMMNRYEGKSPQITSAAADRVKALGALQNEDLTIFPQEGLV